MTVSNCRKIPLFISLSVPVLVVAYFLFNQYSSETITTKNSYIKAKKTPLISAVPGFVESVHVIENQSVTTGQKIFSINSSLQKIMVQQKEAEVKKIESQLISLQAQYRVKLTEVERDKNTLEFTNKKFNKIKDLYIKKVISASEYDQSEQEVTTAFHRLNVTRQELSSISKKLGGHLNGLYPQYPPLMLAIAELDRAKYELKNTTVRAPADGIITHVPSVGQYISDEEPSSILLLNDKYWVVANFSERDLTDVKLGQNASIRIDLYPNLILRGYVQSISPATNSEFSVFPANNNTSNWFKVAQIIAVRINLDLNTLDDSMPLRSGASATTVIHIGRKRMFH